MKKGKGKSGHLFRPNKNKKGRKEGEREWAAGIFMHLFIKQVLLAPRRDNGAAKTSGGPQGDNSRPATANCDDSFYPATSSIRLRRTSRHDKSVSR